MAGRAGTVHVTGLKELVRDFRKLESSLAGEVRDELKEVGNIVRDDERAYLGRIGASPKSIGGIRTQVRAGSVSVQQRYGTITGKRGDWGARIMSSLAFGLKKREPEVRDRLDQMLDRLAGRNGF